MSAKVATTKLSVCPVRARAEETSEMVTQLLFGELVEVVEEKKGGWSKIRMLHDKYEGWIDSKMLVSSDYVDADRISYCMDLFGQVFADNHSTWITLGATLPDHDGMVAQLGDITLRYSGQAVKASSINPSKERIKRLALKLLNTPYLWGGRTPLGIDCSGYTQLVLRCNGISIPRDASDQARTGEAIDFVSEADVGDLAFFSKKSEKITHVGIILEDQKIIHASGRVRIDTLDHYGIYNDEIQEYTHRLKIIKRYL